MSTAVSMQLRRQWFCDHTTIGTFSVDARPWGFSLEDAVREIAGQPVESWKVPGKTAIPLGTYRVIVTPSARFKRDLPLLLDVPGFGGVRLHGGNDHTDTEGCPLIARNRPSDWVIQGQLATKLTDLLVSRGGVGVLSIVGARP